MELNGRAVLLTGASGGIGRATALRLARAGARVGLMARGESAVRALAEEITAAGGQAVAIQGDVRSPADAERAVSAMVGRFDGLDALVNNAGLGFLRAVEEATDAEIEEMVETNLLGVIRMTRAALPKLLARPGSALVNVASFAGKVGAPYYSYYAATKFALVGLTEAWRRELGPRGLRVTLLLPAATETSFIDRAGRGRALGMGPAGTILRPEQVAGGIERALRRHPPQIYLPAWNRALAMLNSALPGLSDRIVNTLFRYPRSR
ncbi:MAG TPA: SDR family NAD(P)-dependent oxidoreductase [Candidatus Eisenbacteria bacterium]|nr:SDR family NAD(P)-dependent oxidoreductase [Candidatus Eisenbacteria bacterium]